MKKWIAASMAVLLCVGASLPAGAAPSYGRRSDFLARIGVFDSSPERDASVSRGQLADVAMRMLGANGTGQAQSQAGQNVSGFSDVGDAHPYAFAIAMAAGMGIMNGVGEGKFSPDDAILFEQAVKVLVTVAGYAPYTEKYGAAYPAAYLAVAGELGITKGADASAGERITLEQLAVLVIQTLSLPLLETEGAGAFLRYKADRNVTLLDAKFSIRRSRGIVTANRFTALDDGGVKTRDGQIRISDSYYRSGAYDLTDYLGMEVVFYYRETDGDRPELLYFEPGSRNTVTRVAAEDIAGYSENRLDYYDGNGRRVGLSVSRKVSLLYNGKSYGDFDDTDFRLSQGEVVLVDNDGDLAADVVFLFSYENYVVSGISNEERRIVDLVSTPGVPRSLSLKGAAGAAPELRVIKEEREIAFEDIGLDNVLSVYETKDPGQYLIYVSDTLIQAKAQAIGDDTVVLEGIEYRLAPDFAGALSLDTEGVYYLDMHRRVAAVDYSKARADKFGILMGVSGEKGLSDKVELRMLTAQGRIEVFPAAKKVRRNNRTDNLERGYLTADRALWDSDLTFGQNTKLVRYETNGAGEITAVNTAREGAPAAENEFAATRAKANLLFKKAPRMFMTLDGAYSAYSTARTPVFSIPVDREDEEGYVVKGFGSFSDNIGYTVENYQLYGDRFACAVLSYDPDDDYRSEEVPAVIVTSVSDVLDEEGAMYKRISGYMEGSPAFEALVKKPEHADGLGFGDVIVWRKDGSGKLDLVKRLFDFSERQGLVPTSGANRDRSVYGTVEDLEEGVVFVRTPDGKSIRYLVSAARVYYCDGRRERITPAAVTDILTGARVFLRIANEIVKDALIILE